MVKKQIKVLVWPQQKKGSDTASGQLESSRAHVAPPFFGCRSHNDTWEVLARHQRLKNALVGSLPQCCGTGKSDSRQMRSCVPATFDTHAIAVSPRPSWLRRWTKTDYERGGEPSSRWEHRRGHRPIREGFRPLQTVAARAAAGRDGCQARASERKANINSLVPADAGLCVETERIAVLRPQFIRLPSLGLHFRRG